MPGTGGSFAFADPDAQIGYAYATNKCGFYVKVDPPGNRVCGMPSTVRLRKSRPLRSSCSLQPALLTPEKSPLTQSIVLFQNSWQRGFFQIASSPQSPMSSGVAACALPKCCIGADEGVGEGQVPEQPHYASDWEAAAFFFGPTLI